MSSFDYEELASAADELIRFFGQSGTLRKFAPGTGTFDPTPGAAVDSPAAFAFSKFRQEEVDGSRVVVGDRKVILSSQGLLFPPEAGMIIIESDDTPWQVVSPLGIIRPATTTLYYALQVRI
jgi:hypothetical protein